MEVPAKAIAFGINTDALCCGNSGREPKIIGYYANEGDPPEISG